MTASDAHSVDDCRRHALFIATASNDPSMTELARVVLRWRLDTALEAAEEGHVEGLQVRSAVRWNEAQHHVRERHPHGGHGGLAGVDAGHVPEKDPRLSFLSRVHHVVQCGRELQDRGRRGPAVL